MCLLLEETSRGIAPNFACALWSSASSKSSLPAGEVVTTQFCHGGRWLSRVAMATKMGCTSEPLGCLTEHFSRCHTFPLWNGGRELRLLLTSSWISEVQPGLRTAVISTQESGAQHGSGSGFRGRVAWAGPGVPTHHGWDSGSTSSLCPV